MNNTYDVLFPINLNENTKLFLTYLLEQATITLRDLLQQFANEAIFADKIQLAFEENTDSSEFKASWQTGEFTFPQIEVTSRTEINNANGAFSKDTNKIYLAQEFLLANQSNIDAINAVLLEEYGHYVDSQLNVRDSSGDEGAIFAALVQGEELSESELQRLRNEDDSAVVSIDDNRFNFEFNESDDFSFYNDPDYRIDIFASWSIDLNLYKYTANHTFAAGQKETRQPINFAWRDLNADGNRSIDESYASYTNLLGEYSIDLPVTKFEDNESSLEVGEDYDYSGTEANVKATANLSENGGSFSFSVQGGFSKNALPKEIPWYFYEEYTESIPIEEFEIRGYEFGTTVYLYYPLVLEEGFLAVTDNDNEYWSWSLSHINEEGEIITRDSTDGYSLVTGEEVIHRYLHPGGFQIEEAGVYLFSISSGYGLNKFTDDTTSNLAPINFNSSINWTFTEEKPTTFEFTDLVIEGTEGETKQIEVTRTSEDLSNEETVEIKIATAPEGQDLASYLFSSAGTIVNSGLERSKVKDLILEKISDSMVEEVADSAGEPKNSPNRKSTSTKLKNYLGKFISIADIAQSAYSQARATSSDIFPNELSVTFAPGENKATTSIQFLDDPDKEGDELLFLELFQSGKDLESPTAVVAIRDDDQTELVNIGDDGLASIVIDGVVGALTGAVRGFIAGGGIGSAPGILIGGFVGGLTAAAQATLAEILKDVIQREIVDAFVSIKNGDFDNLLNQTEPITGTNDSENLNGGEASDSIDAGGGNDNINSGSGNDTVSGGEGDDTISGGNGSDLLEGGMGADSLSGGEGSDVFGGSLEELNMDRIIDFSSEDVLLLQNTNFTQESLTVTQGSAILDIDTDLDGIIDSTITLEGDYADAEFLVEPVSIEGITETYITINDSTPRPETEGSGLIVDRFFNPDAGVHFYTADENESNFVRENLDNYVFEGESYLTVDPVTGNNPEEVYRFFNSTTGVHLYTTNENERDYIIDNLDNFAYEDVKFHAYETETAGTVAIHRFYEPNIGVHFYTPNEAEKIFVEESLANYTYEGIAYYAFPINNS